MDREVGAIILKISCGYTVESFGNDTLVDLAGAAMTKLSHAFKPGAFLVDIFPFSK